MDLSKELKFNLYNILVIPLEETIDEISYLYKGKLNEPNVMVIENGDMTPFVCEKLIVKKTQNPEIVILCKNIVNYENPVYLHIPLVYNGFSEPNIIDTLLRTSMKQELEINLNELLENDNVTYGSDKNENHYYFQTPLLIQTKMNQHIIEGLASESHFVEDPSHNNTTNNTLKMFTHNEDDSLDGGQSIHLLGNQEMICTEQGEDEDEENDYVPDESMEKHIYTALSCSFVGWCGIWFYGQEWFYGQKWFFSFEFIQYIYNMFLENSIIIRLVLLVIGCILLGFGGGNSKGSKKQKDGAIAAMFFAGLFFAFGIMPIQEKALPIKEKALSGDGE